AIKDERERVRREATRAGGPGGGPVTTPIARECSFASFIKCGPTQLHGIEGVVGLVDGLKRWRILLKLAATLGREVANGRPWSEKKVELYIKGFPEIIKGQTMSSRPVTLNEAVRMAHALIKQKIQAKNGRIAEGLKRKWENNNQGNNNNNSHNR
nr:hypothetical protein [Tanacetum cinerariifolium]